MMNCECEHTKPGELTQNETESRPRVPGEWVKELFAPIYDFDAIVAAGRDGYKNEDRKPLRVPILDPVAIREVFERVHQRVTEWESKQIQEIKEEEEKKLEKQLDPRQSSIWNTEELDTLRKVYKSAKGEVNRLEVRLHEQTEHNEVLELTVKKLRREIEKLTESLAEATKANHRLSIHRDSLLRDQAILDVKLSALTDMWHDIESEKVKAMDEEKRARMELNKERLTRQKLETDVLESKQNHLRDLQFVESNIQTKYEMEMNDLHDVIKDLTVTLRDERNLHTASKRGLEHLRNHFSSLPLHHILAPNAVVEDEVEHIDHCSL